MFSISKFIHLPIFIASLAIGIFFVYVFDEEKKTIYVYPKPDNIDSIQYRDSTGTCFAVKQEKVSCPQNPLKIAPQT
jgi:hypothetical protein